MNVTIFLLLLLCFTEGPSALAQSSLEGFSTGRYEIHKSTKSSRKPASAESDQATPVTDSEGVQVKVLSQAELAAEKSSAEKVAAGNGAKKVSEKSEDGKAATVGATAATATPVAPTAATAAAGPEKKASEEPSISEQAESLFSSRADQVYEYYRQEVHEDDIRNNKVEVEFAPVVAYNDSQSNYSFRDYQSFFEALKIRANVWLTPLIGISGQMLFSFAADVDDGNHNRASTKYENLDLALNFRKFFGLSRKANSLEFSVLYSDDNFNVSKDSVSHPRLKSSGLGVGLKARFPTSLNYAWVIGGNFFPRLQHSESATAVDINSGSTEENIRVGFDFGGEWKFSRHSQMIWDLGVSSERNLFSGSASLPDPSTGSTPSNVSVTNTMYMLNLGYRWGH